MSESEDDWFEKDIDEFVVQAPPSNVEHISVAKVPDADSAIPVNTIYADAGSLMQNTWNVNDQRLGGLIFWF